MLKKLIYCCLVIIIITSNIFCSLPTVLPQLDTLEKKSSQREEQSREKLIGAHEAVLKSIVIGKHWQQHIDCLASSSDQRFAIMSNRLINLSIFPEIIGMDLSQHQEPISKGLFSRDSSMLVSISRDAVVLWSLDQFPLCRSVKLTTDPMVSVVEFAQNNTLLIGFRDGRCNLYRYNSATQEGMLTISCEQLIMEPLGEPTCAVFSFQSDKVALGFAHGGVACFDISQRPARAITLAGNLHKSTICSLEFDYDGNYLLSAEEKASPLHLWLLPESAIPRAIAKAITLRTGPPENYDLALHPNGAIFMKEGQQPDAKCARKNQMHDSSNARTIKLAQERHASAVRRLYSSEDSRWMITISEHVSLADGEEFIPPCLLWDFAQRNRQDDLQPIRFFYDITSGRRTAQQSLFCMRRDCSLTLYDICMLSPMHELSICDYTGGIFASSMACNSQLWKRVSTEDIRRFITLITMSEGGINIVKNPTCVALLNEMTGPLRALVVIYLQLRSLLKISSERDSMMHSQ